MLVELGLGDAYGSGREYAKPADVLANNDGVTYVQHQKHAPLTPGRYTDDTQMTIGLAEFMLLDKGGTLRSLASHFLHAFQRDPRAGYAGGFYKLLQDVKDEDEFLSLLRPHSDKSGGAMRASPCGLLPTVEEAIDLAMFQASLTHATRDGMGAAAAAASMVWALRNGCDRGYLPQFLEDVLPGFQWLTPWKGPVGAPGLHSVKAALSAIVNHDNMKDILVASVAFTGDVDTVACVALAAASVHPKIPNNLDLNLYRGFEPGGDFGLNFLRDLDHKLMDKFPKVEAKEEEPPASTKLCDHKNPDGSSAIEEAMLFQVCTICGETGGTNT